MSNALAMFEQSSVPAHIKAHFEKHRNIPDRETVPSLSPEGKHWTISVNGEKTTMMTEVDGEQVPAQVMRVVVLDWNKRQGRSYFGGSTYDSKKPGKPICWSDDSIKPDASIKVAPFDGWVGNCTGCPMSVKGSKSDGEYQGYACGTHRMLAVVPANRLNFTPLRLKISQTSDYDGLSPDQDAQKWFAFKQFIQYLQGHGYTDTGAFVTKMKFDPKANWPKIKFQPDRWLSDEELVMVEPVATSDTVKKLLAGTWTPAGVDGVKKEDLISAAIVEPEPEIEVIKAKPAAEPSAKPAAKPSVKPAAKPVTVTKTEELPPEIADIVGEFGWEDE
jgi:hypothetical protein